jgi:hypothetical protein
MHSEGFSHFLPLYALAAEESAATKILRFAFDGSMAGLVALYSSSALRDFAVLRAAADGVLGDLLVAHDRCGWWRCGGDKSLVCDTMSAGASLTVKDIRTSGYWYFGS